MEIVSPKKKLHQIQLEKDQQEHRRQLEELQSQNERDLERQQQQMQAQLDEQARQDKRRLQEYKNKMDNELQAVQLQTMQQIEQLTAEQQQEKEEMIQRAEAQRAAMQFQYETLENNMRLANEENKRKQEEMLKIIEKKNYESHYPVPDFLQQHLAKHPRAFHVQILGCRGAGKSTFVNKLLMKAGIANRAATGSVETTKETAFFNITDKVVKKPARYDQVFIVDQPGIGGLEITEAGYLAKFGPGEFKQIYKNNHTLGHFNFTLMLGEKGFNEIDMALFKHLLFNKRPVAFIRTQCDSAIVGIQDEHEMKVPIIL